MTSPATYRCTACGREFGATSPAVVFGVHGVGPRSRLTCTSGSLVPVGPVTLPIARDDRAGVTLPTAVEPVGGDQLVAGSAGQVESESDTGGCGHEDSIATGGADGHVNRPMATGPAASVDFTERNHA